MQQWWLQSQSWIFPLVFHQKIVNSVSAGSFQVLGRLASTLFTFRWAQLQIPASHRAVAAAVALQLTSESPAETANLLFRDQYSNYNIYLCHAFLNLLALVIIKYGVKTDKQAAFLRWTQWESCLILLYSSDEDNAAVATIVNQFYWRKKRSCPKPNMVINSGHLDHQS